MTKITFEALGKTQEITFRDWEAYGHHRLYISDGRKDYGYYDMKAEIFVCALDTVSADWCEAMKSAVKNFVSPASVATQDTEMEMEIPEVDDTKRMDYLGNWLALREISVSGSSIRDLPDLNRFALLEVYTRKCMILFHDYETEHEIEVYLNQSGTVATLKRRS